ncbi:MAG: glutaredoxin-related protein [Psychromonas sp.]|jgi:glutaredoxin-related protein
MTYNSYRDLFNEIILEPNKKAPYDDADFFNYLVLNQKREDRWNKKGEINHVDFDKFKSLNTKMNWVLITEPWCGDAAHCCPFINKLVESNLNINLDVQLRDSDSEIDNYLTNGGKSIPILIVRDENNKDLFTWGPRPKAAQEIHLANLKSDKSKEEQKIELQKWYNSDKGETVIKELFTLLKL